MNEANSESAAAISKNNIVLSEQLKKSSYDFTSANNIENSIIKVDIDQQEVNQVFINFTCKGLSYFMAKKSYPLFTYELNNNSFFVFTGAEQMLQISFDGTKYKHRRRERCDSVILTCYLFQDGKMTKEDNCTFPEAFSTLPPPLPLPKK